MDLPLIVLHCAGVQSLFHALGNSIRLASFECVAKSSNDFIGVVSWPEDVHDLIKNSVRSDRGCHQTPKPLWGSAGGCGNRNSTEDARGFLRASAKQPTDLPRFPYDGAVGPGEIDLFGKTVALHEGFPIPSRVSCQRVFLVLHGQAASAISANIFAANYETASFVLAVC